MRLGLSMMLMAALAAGSVACSSSTGDGAGGSGGGAGGDDTGSGGGTTTAQGTGGGGDTGGGGGTSDGICESTNVADPDTECDVDCDFAIEGATGVNQCTVTCDPAVGCSEGSICVIEAEGDTEGWCMFDCEVDACPGTAEFVCDQDLLVCVPDGLSE